MAFFSGAEDSTSADALGSLWNHYDTPPFCFTLLLFSLCFGTRLSACMCLFPFVFFHNLFSISPSRRILVFCLLVLGLVGFWLRAWHHETDDYDLLLWQTWRFILLLPFGWVLHEHSSLRFFALCGQLSLIICFYWCTFIFAHLWFLFIDLAFSFLLNLMRHMFEWLACPDYSTKLGYVFHFCNLQE